MIERQSTPPKKRLLVVDDEAHVRTAIMRALMVRGYAVSGAPSGEAALEALANDAFDLMVLDIKMPGIDGVEVMRQARAIQPELLIIILTGYATLDSALLAVKVHAADYLLKPASMSDISDAINRALTGQLRPRENRSPAQVPNGSLITAPPVLPDDSHRDLNAPSKAERFVCYKSLMLDREYRLIYLDGDANMTVSFTSGEFAVLDALFSHPGQALSCRQVVKLGLGTDVTDAEAKTIVRPYVSRLRKKLRPLGLPGQLVVTVRGLGYALRLRD